MKRIHFIQKTLWTAGGIVILPHTALNLKTRKDLKKVVLIGDSIRIGYQPFVVKELENLAEVWASEENGKATPNIINNLNSWIKMQQPDVVHINAGLHDIRNLSWELGPGNTVVPYKHYKDNLETIFSWIQKYVGCKVIWATTTPVIDEYVKTTHESTKDYTRYDEDVQKINIIAMKIARKYDIIINDLYTYVKEEVGINEIKQDGVHFTDTGSEKLGQRVASVIKDTIMDSSIL